MVAINPPLRGSEIHVTEQILSDRSYVLYWQWSYGGQCTVTAKPHAMPHAPCLPVRGKAA